MKSPRILLSFLGGGRLLDPATGKPKQYHRTSYLFPDGHEARGSQFFGLEVVRWKDKSVQPFDQVLLAGTSTSMWDLFAQQASQDGLEIDGLALDLIERCEPRADGSMPTGADQENLAALAASLSRHRWMDVPVWSCLDLPMVRDQGQLMEWLSRLASWIPQGTELWIDITHGFRIFPMFALALGQILSATKKVSVKGILYGAYDMRDATNVAPVVDLAGLLRLQQWTDALAAFEDSGTLSPFVPLLKEDGARLGGQVEKLREITQAERANSLHRVREARVHATAGLKREPLPEGTVSSLFASALENAVKPYPAQLSQAQRERARHFLEHDDLLQATILCHEGMISRAVEKAGLDAWSVDYRDRERIAKELNEDRTRDAALLGSVRNGLAHGTASNWPKAEDLRRNPDKLAGFLDGLLRRRELWD